MTHTVRVVALAAALASPGVAADRVPPNRFPGTHWEQRDPASLGLDGAVLDRLAEALGGRGCVVKDGYVVKTWGAQAEIGDWFSSAKPVLSTLLFFAIAEGKVPNADTPIKEFGWELNAKDQGITFRHLADMTSGFRRPEPSGAAYAYNDFAIQLYQKTLFDKVFRDDPERVANDPKRLGFLGLEDGLKFRAKDRRLSASVRDFARIAWFWLNSGNWNGAELLPARLFRDYRKPDVPRTLPISRGADSEDYLGIGTYGGGSNQVRTAGPGNYGFNWWFNQPGPKGDNPLWPDAPPDLFASLGARGNCSFVIPHLNLALISAFGAWGPNPEESANPHLRLLMQAAGKARP